MFETSVLQQQDSMVLPEKTSSNIRNMEPSYISSKPLPFCPRSCCVVTLPQSLGRLILFFLANFSRKFRWFSLSVQKPLTTAKDLEVGNHCSSQCISRRVVINMIGVV